MPTQVAKAKKSSSVGRYLADVKLETRYLLWLWGKRRKITPRNMQELWRGELEKNIRRHLGARWAEIIAVKRPHKQRILRIVLRHNYHRLNPAILPWVRKNVLGALKARPGQPGWFYRRSMLVVQVCKERDLLREQLDITLHEREKK